MTFRVRAVSGPIMGAALILLCGCQGQASSVRSDGGSGNGGLDSSVNAGQADSATPGMDGAVSDAAVPKPDAGAPDAGEACKPFVPPADCDIPENGSLPSELRCTGLYSDAATRSIACGVLPYAPAHALWTDGAVKNRWVSLPANGRIDVTDPDSFVYPVGTQFWKEFNIKKPDGSTRLGETRIMRKVTAQDWVYSTYVWNEEGTNATKQDNGVVNLFGLNHDVPTRDQCLECHQGRRNIDAAVERLDLILGWDPILLGPGATGVTWETLTAMNALTIETDGGLTRIVREIPGAPVEQAALGYLHVNCGVSCHNSGTQSKANQTGFFMRLVQGKLDSVHDTDTVIKGIHNPPGTNLPQVIKEPVSGAFFDIRPGDLERSLVINRMSRRDAGKMPSLGTNVTDPDGISAVSDWIEYMTEEHGYPAALP